MAGMNPGDQRSEPSVPSPAGSMQTSKCQNVKNILQAAAAALCRKVRIGGAVWCWIAPLPFPPAVAP